MEHADNLSITEPIKWHNEEMRYLLRINQTPSINMNNFADIMSTWTEDEFRSSNE